MPLQVAGDASAGYPADLGGDLLDCDHQRKAEDEGPREVITELRADLAVRADAAGIIVSRAGNQTGAEALEKTANSLGRFGFGLGCFGHRAAVAI